MSAHTSMNFEDDAEVKWRIDDADCYIMVEDFPKAGLIVGGSLRFMERLFDQLGQMIQDRYEAAKEETR